MLLGAVEREGWLEREGCFHLRERCLHLEPQPQTRGGNTDTTIQSQGRTALESIEASEFLFVAASKDHEHHGRAIFII